jgi:hypothetical protein
VEVYTPEGSEKAVAGVELDSSTVPGASTSAIQGGFGGLGADSLLPHLDWNWAVVSNLVLMGKVLELLNSTVSRHCRGSVVFFSWLVASAWAVASYEEGMFGEMQGGKSAVSSLC